MIFSSLKSGVLDFSRFASTLNDRDVNGSSPFMVAAQLNNVQLLQSLERAGAKVTARDNVGQTCLHYAARAGAVECVKVTVIF